MRTPEPVVLDGRHARLEPLAHRHAADLLAAGRDPKVWRWMPGPAFGALEDVTAFVADALGQPGRLAYAVVVGGRAVGSSSYLDIDVELEALEIGWTWYAPEHWATRVNPQCKRLLLGHAFDTLCAQRVTLKTDALNTRSRAAIARLGARYDGTLRHQRRRPDGSVRDAAYFSILAPEWPAVREALAARLA